MGILKMSDTFKYFTVDEFKCKETGDNHINEDFIFLLDRLRGLCGFPFVISSGYRSPMHSAEKGKAFSGTHTQGIAADIYIHRSSDRYKILDNAFSIGFTGIGVANSFIHLDTRKTTPVVWLYGA